jgi:type II secretion system protein C
MIHTVLAFAALAALPPDAVVAGVVVARRPEHSVAVLRAEGKSRVVGVGDIAFGGRVERIAATGVVLSFGETRVEVRMALATTPPPADTPARAPARADTPEAEPAARSLPRAEVQRRLADELPRILAETALMPVTDGGQIVGMAITRMPETSLLSEVGLKAGDVLTRLNDTPIDGLASLMALYPRLQSERELRAVVLRNGQPVNLALTLR